MRWSLRTDFVPDALRRKRGGRGKKGRKSLLCLRKVHPTQKRREEKKRLKIQTPGGEISVRRRERKKRGATR